MDNYHRLGRTMIVLVPVAPDLLLASNLNAAILMQAEQ